MKQIKIAGFKADTSPDDKPAVNIFGETNTGRSRFTCTMPHENGVIGYIPLDKNTLRTIHEYQETHPGIQILIPEKPFIDAKSEIEIAMLDSGTAADRGKVMAAYTERTKRIFEFGMRLAEHPDVESIAVDASQLFDFILFSHFGRRNQIESYMRGAPNQEMIDFVSALRFKNVCWVHRAGEIWAETGEVDKDGKKKQSPTGRFKPDGCAKIAYSMTATLQFLALRKKGLELDTKYSVQVMACKGNTLLEGQTLNEYGVVGEAITWDNVMMALGIGG